MPRKPGQVRKGSTAPPGGATGSARIEPAPASTTPPLLGFLVLSRDSYEHLKGFFRWRAVELDTASGFALHLVDVADPSVSGELYRLARSEAARTGDADAAQVFEDGAQPEGPVDARRMQVMNKLAEMLAVGPAERPCIVFAGVGRLETIATFRLESAWYATPEARSVLGGALRDWIADLRLDGATATPAARPVLAERLESELRQVRRRLDSALQGRPREETAAGGRDPGDP